MASAVDALLWVIVAFVALVMVAVVVGYVVSLYNRLVRLQERCNNTWSDIDVVLKQRRDALEKLIDTVQQSMEYESELLQDLTEVREQIDRADSPSDEANADERLKSLLAELRAEAYPELDATENLGELQTQIETLEQQIADRREHYNEAVTRYNTRIRQFPYLLFAGPMGFENRELFEASDAETADVDVDAAFGPDGPSEGAGDGSEADGAAATGGDA